MPSYPVDAWEHARECGSEGDACAQCLREISTHRRELCPHTRFGARVISECGGRRVTLSQTLVLGHASSKGVDHALHHLRDPIQLRHEHIHTRLRGVIVRCRLDALDLALDLLDEPIDEAVSGLDAAPYDRVKWPEFVGQRTLTQECVADLLMWRRSHHWAVECGSDRATASRYHPSRL